MNITIKIDITTTETPTETTPTTATGFSTIKVEDVINYIRNLATKPTTETEEEKFNALWNYNKGPF